jgi:pantetheine-phosphate adenylyltransferase
MKRAVFPGSFDPFTKGHELIVKKAMQLFDEIIIGVGQNSSKVPLFELNKRLTHIQSLFGTDEHVKVMIFNGLTVDFCKEKGAQYIVRGLRNSNDFEFEAAIAQMNLDLAGVETVFLLTDPKFSAVSSTIVREIYKNGGAIEKFVTNQHLLV